MLFNEKLGKFPIDAPFDIDKHRVSTYALSTKDAKSKPARAILEKLATAAIRTIILKQPPTPFSLILQTPDEIKRQRDIENIKWAMSAIHIPTLDDMIYRLPRYLNLSALHFWESFNGVITNSLFHVYDEEANTALRSVHKAWKECVSHGEQYGMASNPNLYVFANPGDGSLDEQQEQEWSKIESACAALRESFDKLLRLIRQRYLEIHIEETNGMAWRDYVDSEKELDKQLEH